MREDGPGEVSFRLPGWPALAVWRSAQRWSSRPRSSCCVSRSRRAESRRASSASSTCAARRGASAQGRVLAGITFADAAATRRGFGGGSQHRARPEDAPSKTQRRGKKKCVSPESNRGPNDGNVEFYH